MRVSPPSYANVMSTVAVFIALGGTSYAVTKLPKGSVGERELRNNAVSSSKIKDGAVTAADLAPGAVPSGARGPRGAEGAKGDLGPSNAWFTDGVASSGSLSPVEKQGTTVARLANLPAGSYVFHGSVSIVAHDVPSVFTYCQILVNGRPVSAASVATLGSAAGYARAGTLAPNGATTIGEGFQVTLDCWNDRATAPGTTPSFQQIGLNAIRVATLN
ncbi:MAG: hypothetical protein JHD16_01090 [Solirubrobacteraceae bacterium]|nr:hypothetical protein [Solirubrobacteraceae bacterium]